MATSNLQKRSLGSTELSSGQGSPDHFAPSGSLYTDTLNGKIYISLGANDSWELLQSPCYGELYLSANTTVTTIASSNTWVSVSDLTGWTFGASNGFTQSGTSSLLLGANKSGKYFVTTTATLQYNLAAATYDIGISVNGDTPAAGRFHSVSMPTTTPTSQKTITVHTYIDLLANDTISIVLRSTTATNIILRHATLVATKIF
jgi:hypothetical protein